MAVIEMMTFRLRPGVDPTEFIASDAAVQAAFSYQQRGIVRRTIACADDGAWLVHTIWDSPDAATDAAEAFNASDLCAGFTAMIDADTIDIRRYSPAGAP